MLDDETTTAAVSPSSRLVNQSQRWDELADRDARRGRRPSSRHLGAIARPKQPVKIATLVSVALHRGNLPAFWTFGELQHRDACEHRPSSRRAARV